MAQRALCRLARLNEERQSDLECISQADLGYINSGPELIGAQYHSALPLLDVAALSIGTVFPVKLR